MIKIRLLWTVWAVPSTMRGRQRELGPELQVEVREARDDESHQQYDQGHRRVTRTAGRSARDDLLADRLDQGRWYVHEAPDHALSCRSAHRRAASCVQPRKTSPSARKHRTKTPRSSPAGDLVEQGRGSGGESAASEQLERLGQVEGRPEQVRSCVLKSRSPVRDLLGARQQRQPDPDLARETLKTWKPSPPAPAQRVRRCGDSAAARAPSRRGAESADELGNQSPPTSFALRISTSPCVESSEARRR